MSHHRSPPALRVRWARCPRVGGEEEKPLKGAWRGLINGVARWLDGCARLDMGKAEVAATIKQGDSLLILGGLTPNAVFQVGL